MSRVLSRSESLSMHPAVLMYVAHRHSESRVLEHLAACDFADLTVSQARVVARVGEQGTRLTELAERTGVTKQSAGSLVDALERQGYLERVPDPTDARARLVRLAPRGKAARDAAREVEKELLREWADHLGADRLATLQELLADLREITDR